MNHMSLSTSSSEVRATFTWRRWLGTAAIVFAAALASIWVLLLLVDPYDSGRFSPLPQSAAFDSNARTANASRGRNATFDSAIIGNSTAVALDPALMSEDVGGRLHFAQLSVVMSGPREQLTVLRWFISHHQKIGAVIVVADRTWCTTDESAPLDYPFPFWLYGDNIDYLRHLLSWHSLELSFRRVRLLLRLRAPARRLDGFWDFEGETTRAFPRPPPIVRNTDINHVDPATDAQAMVVPDLKFPFVNQLEATVARLPASSIFVVVAPPVFSGALPTRHTSEAANKAQCNSALAKAAATRMGSLFLDFADDNEMTRDPANFIDATHYRAKIARYMEASISKALAGAVRADP
jgi:hypothetical protein